MRSAAHRPPKSMRSRACPGTGIRKVSSVTSNGASPTFSKVARTRTSPVGSISTTNSIHRLAETASKAYSTTAGPATMKSSTGRPLTRTSLMRQPGLHPLPAQEPIRPGVPVQPYRPSGIIPRRGLRSTELPGTIQADPSRSASNSASVTSPRSVPQWTTSGIPSCPAEISNATPAERRTTRAGIYPPT